MSFFWAHSLRDSSVFEGIFSPTETPEAFARHKVFFQSSVAPVKKLSFKTASAPKGEIFFRKIMKKAMVRLTPAMAFCRSIAEKTVLERINPLSDAALGSSFFCGQKGETKKRFSFRDLL